MKQLILFPFDPEPVVMPDLDSSAYVHFESIDPEENRFRFYTITWQQTLWDEWTIRTTWVRIGGVGGSRVTYFENEEALREALPSVVARRIARGYVARGLAGATMCRMPPPVHIRAQQVLTVHSNVHTDRLTA